MIEIGNKRWRNLQEQVAWLTAMIGQATDVVKNVYGKVADAASLPDASTFSNGTTYAVGSATPYEYYVAINGSWLDIGTFPLEGPAGTDGQDGKSIFITSQATTSGTTNISKSSVYNPDNLTIGAGDLILSEQGDIFAISGSTASVYYVVYRCNIKGPTGATGATGATGPAGTSVFTSSATTSSGTTAIQTSTINVPTGYTAKAGDLIVSASGDVFINRGAASLPGYTDVTYCYNIHGAAGSPGAAGADGATWYEGSDMTYDSVGSTYDLDTSDAPGIKAGDLYLITSNYTSDGHDFTKGDIFTVSSISGTTCDCAFVCSILGPQGNTGATGADGAVWYVDNDIFYSSSPVKYYVNLEDYPDIKVGDLYLISSNYTSGTHDFTKGDVFEVTSIDDVLEEALLTYKTSILGPAGASTWGSITGTLSNQTDLQNALNAKLSLSGGTMTGDITLTNHDIKAGTRTVFEAGNGSTQQPRIGNKYINGNLILYTKNNSIIHGTENGNGQILDTWNTQANPTLAGTEADLTGLKINGTSYKVPSGGGGGASIGGIGFDFENTTYGVSSGTFTALILGEYNNTFGWHRFNFIGYDANNSTIDGTSLPDYGEATISNASIVIFESFNNTDLDNFATGALVAYDGTAITSANLSSYVGKMLYLVNDFNIEYLD